MQNNLQKLREKDGWSEVEFAQVIGVDPMVLRRIEAGSNQVPIQLALRMADLLGVAVRTIFPLTSMAKPDAATSQEDRGGYRPPIVVWSPDNVVYRDAVFRFRNGQRLELSVPQPEIDRVGRILAADREQQNFAVFDAYKHHVMLNVAHIQHVMFESDGYRVPLSEDCYVDGDQRQHLPDSQILVLGVDARPAVEIFVEPDMPGNMEGMDSGQPLAFLMADIDMNLGLTSFVFISDMDGDQHVLNLDDVAALVMHKGLVGGKLEEFDDWDDEELESES